MKRSVVVIGIMALAIGLLGIQGVLAETAGPTVTNGSISPSVVTAGTPVTITADISDPSGINWIVLSVGGAEGTQNTTISAGGVTTFHLNNVINTTGFGEGEHTVVIMAVDTLFQWATYPANFTWVMVGSFTVDTAGPTVTNGLISPSVVTAGTPVTITADISDPSGINWIVLSVGGAEGTQNTTISAGGVTTFHLNNVINTTGFGEGEHTVVIMAVDTLFQWVTYPSNFTWVMVGSFNIDEPPIVTITHPKDGEFTAAALNVAGNAWDTVDGPLPVEVSINPVVLQSDESGDFGGQIVGPNTGEIVITARAVDSAGNEGSDSVTILRVHDNRK